MDSLIAADSPPNDAPALQEVPNAADLVVTDVDDLVVGRVLRYPIFDTEGLLLLAEGVSLTEEFKRTLDGRNIRVVQVHTSDYSRLTARGAEDPSLQKTLLDEDLVRRLDEIVDSGLLFVVNSESALLDQITHHGSTNYDRREHLDRISRNKETSVFVDNLIRNAVRGKAVNCGEVARLTANYLNDITADIDSTLASRLDTIRHSAISDHCVAMAVLGMALGIEMGLDARNVRMIALAGLLHDWGMIQVPEEIRDASHRLTEEEYFEIMKHPIHTLRMLDQMCGVPPSVPVICYQVHERPNGDGYPKGRKDTQIHLMARILAVADAYNALISPRPFRPPLTPYAAMECLLRQAASGDFDPQVVHALLTVQSLFPIGSYVVLTDGSVARVLRRNGANYLQPIVRIMQDPQGIDVPEDSQDSIVDMSSAGVNVAKTLRTPGTKAIGLNPEILNLGRRIAVQADRAADDVMADRLMAQFAALTAHLPAVQTPDAEVISLQAYTEKQQRLARRALDLLDGSRTLTDRQYASTRNHPRTAARTVATICLLHAQPSVVDVQSGLTFRAITQDISQGGICFIHPGPLMAGDILVGLSLSDDERKWFLGQIVRRREIGDTTFWEYGVAFRQRVTL